MKNLSFTRYFGAVAALFLLAGMAAPSAHGQLVNRLVTYFNFEDQNLAADPAVPAPLQFPTMTTTFSAGVNGYTFPAGQGTLSNAAPGNVQIANSPLSLDTDKGANNGKSIQFSVSTLNLSSLSLSYATIADNGTGFTTQTLAYSINGGSFVFVGTFSPVQSGYTLATFALPAAVDNQTTVAFRLTFSGAGNGNNERTYIDNIQLIGKVPEPATVAAGALAALALCWQQRRRLFKGKEFLSLRRKAA